MPRISQVFACLKVLSQLAKWLAFTNQRYDYAKHEIKQTRRVHRIYVMICATLDMLSPIAFILINCKDEYSNYMLNTYVEAGSRPMFNAVEFFDDILSALAYFFVYLRYKNRRHSIVRILKETVALLQIVRRTIKAQFRCQFWMLTLAYMLVLKMLLGFIYHMHMLYKKEAPLSDFDSITAWRKYFVTLWMTRTAVLFYIHLLYYYGHLMLQACIFYSFNNFIENKMSRKYIAGLQKLISLQTNLQELHADVANYMKSFIFWYTCTMCYRFYAFLSVFTYDDVTLSRQDISLEDAEDEAEESVEKVVQLPRPILVWLASLQLAWVFSLFMSLLYVAHTYYREKLLFKRNLYDMIGNPEYFEQPNVHASNAETQLDITNPDAIRQSIPQKNIYDIMLEANVKLTIWSNDDVLLTCSARRRRGILLKSAIDGFKLLLSVALFALLVDFMQQSDLRALEILSKSSK